MSYDKGSYSDRSRSPVDDSVSLNTLTTEELGAIVRNDRNEWRPELHIDRNLTLATVMTQSAIMLGASLGARRWRRRPFGAYLGGCNGLRSAEKVRPSQRER